MGNEKEMRGREKEKEEGERWPINVLLKVNWAHSQDFKAPR